MLRERADHVATAEESSSLQTPTQFSVSMRQMHVLWCRSAATCFRRLLGWIHIPTHACLSSTQRGAACMLPGSVSLSRGDGAKPRPRQGGSGHGTPARVITIAADGRSNLESRLRLDRLR
ncbi:hypothetical protein CMUS01_05997 [Colletotrichum musicola]|uniref:Uncharacterized protein n=1 Tax=Colletotrichum musicola TaxID=2175873 RepID=A0A8H6KPF1_9PEZI|nr:hypothetical protein CMUS01_05997 [Colletotrichum musicola]